MELFIRKSGEISEWWNHETLYLKSQVKRELFVWHKGGIGLSSCVHVFCKITKEDYIKHNFPDWASIQNKAMDKSNIVFLQGLVLHD